DEQKSNDDNVNSEIRGNTTGDATNYFCLGIPKHLLSLYGIFERIRTWNDNPEDNVDERDRTSGGQKGCKNESEPQGVDLKIITQAGANASQYFAVLIAPQFFRRSKASGVGRR